MEKDFGKRKLGAKFFDSVESSKILKTPSDFILQEDGVYFLFYVLTSSTATESSSSVREGIVRLQSFKEHPENKCSHLGKENSSIWIYSPFIIDFSKNIKSSRKNLKNQRYQVSYFLRDSWSEKNIISLAAKKICKSVESIPSCGVIRGDESFWEASLLRLCMQVSGNIFGYKVKLREIFSSYPHKVLKKYTDLSKKIESILQKDNPSHTFLQKFGSILVESGLFQKYEGRFLDLIKAKKKQNLKKI